MTGAPSRSLNFSMESFVEDERVAANSRIAIDACGSFEGGTEAWVLKVFGLKCQMLRRDGIGEAYQWCVLHPLCPLRDSHETPLSSPISSKIRFKYTQFLHPPPILSQSPPKTLPSSHCLIPPSSSAVESRYCVRGWLMNFVDVLRRGSVYRGRGVRRS